MENPKAPNQADEPQRHRDEVQHPIGRQGEFPDRHRRVNNDGRQRHEQQRQAGTGSDVADDGLQEVRPLLLALIPPEPASEWALFATGQTVCEIVCKHPIKECHVALHYGIVPPVLQFDQFLFHSRALGRYRLLRLCLSEQQARHDQ